MAGSVGFTWADLANGFASDVSPINDMGRAVASHDAALVGVEQGFTITKVGDWTSTTSTTLQDITGFLLPLSANAKYVFDILLAYTAPTANDIGFGCTNPAGSSMISLPNGLVLAATIDEGSTRWAVSTSASGLIINLGGAGASPVGCRWSGKLQTAGASGNFQIQAAPLTGGATVTVKDGSYIRAVRVS